jgi:hypothetical protein
MLKRIDVTDDYVGDENAHEYTDGPVAQNRPVACTAKMPHRTGSGPADPKRPVSRSNTDNKSSGPAETKRPVAMSTKTQPSDLYTPPADAQQVEMMRTGSNLIPLGKPRCTKKVAEKPVKNTAILAATDIGNHGFIGSAVGKIAERIQFWTDTIEADEYALNIIRNGYRIQVDPEIEDKVYREPNNRSADVEHEFAVAETLALLNKGQILECNSPVQCTNPMTVSVKRLADGTKKRRFCMDFSRHINLNIGKDNYRMATLKHALEDANEGDYASVCDVKSAFHHIQRATDTSVSL